ncbi:MAG TPA: FKBP-type peptidyl-prolyl cis-trans isomerase [Solirubrobacteraceae bacterium]|nr:FKBP-type peptidyl-prolyl cis-trans isomerase [Solirubrobacteraceae bacterium]
MGTRTIALLAAAAVSVGACGDDEGDRAAPASPATTAAPATTATTSGDRTAALDISTNLSRKPKIPEPSGDPPSKLVTDDVVVGRGRAAKAGDTVVVHYVGALWSTGEQFDASWDRGRPFSLTLGRGDVIPGWDRGIEGMKVGGRRTLIIPPELAYGAQGQGPIGPDETLIFVVDLLNVTPA